MKKLLAGLALTVVLASCGGGTTADVAASSPAPSPKDQLCAAAAPAMAMLETHYDDPEQAMSVYLTFLKPSMDALDSEAVKYQAAVSPPSAAVTQEALEGSLSPTDLWSAASGFDFYITHGAADITEMGTGIANILVEAVSISKLCGQTVPTDLEHAFGM